MIMIKQRKDAYIELIQDLLNCSSDKEGEILQENRDLLDAKFLQMVEAVAKMMWEEGNKDTANWLRNLGNQLAETWNIDVEYSLQVQIKNLSEEDFQVYFQFLMEVLEAIENSNANVDIIYPLLEANIDKLDDILAEILRRWALGSFKEVETDIAKSIAAIVFDFGYLIWEFPLGNKASNIEIAVTSYETVLKLYNRQDYPVDWAMSHNNLGLAYWERIKGNKVENIEKAIQSYNKALKVRTRKDFPLDWAQTQNNLGIAYVERIKGDIALCVRLFWKEERN